MVENLSPISNKTSAVNQRTRSFSSIFKKLRLPILIIIAIAILVGLGVWAQSGVGGKPQAKINQDFSIQG